MNPALKRSLVTAGAPHSQDRLDQCEILLAAHSEALAKKRASNVWDLQGHHPGSVVQWFVSRGEDTVLADSARSFGNSGPNLPGARAQLASNRKAARDGHVWSKPNTELLEILRFISLHQHIQGGGISPSPTDLYTVTNAELMAS